MIEIKTQRGYERLLADPKFIQTAGLVTTAEIIDDPGILAHRALMAAAGTQAQFRVAGREVLCSVQFSDVPLLEPKKMAFCRLKLTEVAQP